MQDSTNNSSIPSPAAASAAAPPEVAGAEAATTTAQVASQANLTAQQTGRTPVLHPLWLAIGAAILFGLIFGAQAILSGGATSASAPSGTTIEQTTINVIQTVDPSVVQIQARGVFGTGGGMGSGVILTKSGYIVTNDHVIHGLSRFTVLLANGQQYPAQLVGEEPTEDLAVLKITANDLKPIAIGNSSQVQVGVYTIALGSPLGLEQSATSGIVSALNRQATAVIGGQAVTLSGMIQTSAPINPGNSGGALVNLQGQLIGIPTLGAVDPSSGAGANGIGFAISTDRMTAFVHHFTNDTL